MAVSLGGGEALVPEVDGQCEGIAEGFREGLGTGGLGADVSGQIEGVTDNDLGAAEFAEEAAEGSEVLPLVLPNEREDRLRREAQFIGDGDADPARAKIEAEDARFHTSS